MPRRPGVPGVLLAVLVLLVLATATSCSTSRDDGSDPQADIRSAKAFALALGVDAGEPAVQRRLAGYDLVVVDGAGTSRASVAALQAQGATVLAYLSVGTLEPGRPWFATAQRHGWLLEHWDDWDEWYGDVAAPGLRTLLVGEARRELRKGFDGLFLDNTDMVETHPAQRRGMQELVASLDAAVGPRRVLFAQNGDPIAAGIVHHLDGWNREDVSFTYDFDSDGYVPVGRADRRAATAALRRVRAAGPVVTATDYLPAVRHDAANEASDRACAAGALPFASDIDLTRIPSDPLTCG